MDRLEGKLHLFKENCNWLATKEKEELENQMNTQINQSIDAELHEYEIKLKKREQEKQTQLEKEYYREIWKLENEAKKKLMKQKERQKKQLEQDLLEKVNQFTMKEEYRDYLIQNIKQAIRKTSEKRENNNCYYKKRSNEV